MAKIEISKESLESFSHNKNVCGISQSEVVKPSKVFAPIDEKNVCSDWINEVFDDCECVESQKKSLCKVCGFIGGELVECTYNFGHNEIVWYLYTLYSKLDETKSELLKRLQRYEGDESDLFSEITDNETSISQRFYFKGE